MGKGTLDNIINNIKGYGAHIKDHFKKNADVYIATGLAGVAGLCFHEGSQIYHSTVPYVVAHDFLVQLQMCVDIIPECITKISPEVMDVPKALIKEGSKYIHTEEAIQLLQNIDGHRYLFEQGNRVQSLADYLDELKGKLFWLKTSPKEISFLAGGALSGALDVFAWMFVYLTRKGKI